MDVQATRIFTGNRTATMSQITWRLKFSNPLIRKDPNYKNIVREVRDYLNLRKNISVSKDVLGGWRERERVDGRTFIQFGRNW